MSCSPARLIANQRNAALSTGPKTEEGKARSRANALKHGLTGAGVVLPEADAAEVERRAEAFAREKNAEGEIGRVLARRAALNSVRMERGADQQAAAACERVRRAEAEFVAPEGVDEDEADRLRDEAVRRAMFDASKESTLARQYEAAAERGFFRALKELHQAGRSAAAASPAQALAEAKAALGSFSEARESATRMIAEIVPPAPAPVFLAPEPPARSSYLSKTPAEGSFDIPITIGRRQ